MKRYLSNHNSFVDGTEVKEALIMLRKGITLATEARRSIVSRLSCFSNNKSDFENIIHLIRTDRLVQ
jgi:hypothetical protein